MGGSWSPLCLLNQSVELVWCYILYACIQSISAKSSKNYPQAKRHGRNALILTIVNIIFAMVLSLLIIGLVTGSCAEYIPSYSYVSYASRSRIYYDGKI